MPDLICLDHSSTRNSLDVSQRLQANVNAVHPTGVETRARPVPWSNALSLRQIERPRSPDPSRTSP